jgi:hypothetical protein
MAVLASRSFPLHLLTVAMWSSASKICAFPFHTPLRWSEKNVSEYSSPGSGKSILSALDYRGHRERRAIGAAQFTERPGTWVTSQTGHIGYTFVPAERRLDGRFELADGPTPRSVSTGSKSPDKMLSVRRSVFDTVGINSRRVVLR